MCSVPGNDSTMAGYIIGVLGVIAVLLAAWIAVWYGKRGRDEDLYRALGRTEGRNGSGDQRGRVVTDDNIYMIIGGLRSDVGNIMTDLREIKQNQESNRTLVQGVRDELGQLRARFDNLSRSVNAFARRGKGAS